MAQKDYPASHSTDTMWYVVDECDHVAACYTGESGALPEGSVEIREYDDREDENRVFWHQSERYSVETIAADHVAVLAEKFGGAHRDPKFSLGSVFYILSGLPEELHPFLITRKGRPTRDPIVRRAGKYVITADFWTGREGAGFYEKVHASGLCVACTAAYSLNAARVGKKGDPVFHYDHPSANCDAWPYFLQYVPENAKTIGGLSISREVKKALRDGLRISGCFKEKILWQPADDFECSMYNEETKPISVTDDAVKGMLRSPFGYW